MTSLPPVRRIITSHAASGEPEVQDDSPMSMPVGDGAFHLAYVQKGLPADPALALEGAKSMPDLGTTQSDGIVTGFIDFAPGQKVAMHFTNTFDYIVVIIGELKVTLHDGSTKAVKPGDLLVQTGNVHELTNESKEPARSFVVNVPSKPRQLNGKSLSEALGAKEGPF